MIVVIDNYDSFVYNLVQMIGSLGGKTRVFRNDAVSLAELRQLDMTGLVISPGPCGPREAGISNAAIEAFAPSLPILGVCLGMQCIAEVFGATIVRAARPMHGKLSAVRHCGTHLLAGLPNPLEVMRYHSLAAARDRVPGSLIVTATTLNGEIMGLRHREHRVEGVQFHPESVFTQQGMRILDNFVRIAAGTPSLREAPLPRAAGGSA